MIICTLDGKKAYPLTSEKIKITYANPYVKDSGTYTYDITFPMAVAQNRRVFGNMQRLDVGKRLHGFEECRLYAGGRLVISGKGTVTSVTNEKVKLQIVGGCSRIKYNSKFERHFIDEIDYPSVVLDAGLRGRMSYHADGKSFEDQLPDTVALDGKLDFVIIDLAYENYVGQRGVCVLAPVEDETNDRMANRVAVMRSPVKWKGKTWWNYPYIPCLLHPAPQPYLFYILGKVLEYEGFKLVRNDFDRDPWNRLVIVSACTTQRLKDTLPHWSVYKFLDEVRKFFNGAFVFDEVHRTVRLVAQNEMLGNDVVTVAPEDDFSVDYDKDGLDSLATRNVEYNLGASANRDWREYITQDVRRQFDVIRFDNEDALRKALPAMTDREKRTRIFLVGRNDYYIMAELPEDGDPENETLTWQLTRCGLFNPYIRDMESDDFQELEIIPAAVYERRNNDDAYKEERRWYDFDKVGDWLVTVPSVPNDKEAGYEAMLEDEDGAYYSTVQDAMQGAETAAQDEGEDDGQMPVAFRPNNSVNREWESKNMYAATCAGVENPEEEELFRAPVLYTDYRMFPRRLAYNERDGKHTMSLEDAGVRSFDATAADPHDVYTVRFVTEDIPDPSRIYVIKNKRFVCEKVEVSVANDGVEPEKTGYFYEL